MKMSQPKIKYCLHAQKKQNGTTIVEAIVAMFVLSFGVLVLMLAQITAVNTSINAANQGEVTRSVQNLIEKMRSNPILSISEKKDENGNKIQYIAKNYSNYATTDLVTCSNRLSIHLINAEISRCIIKATGEVEVNWSGQTLNNETDVDEFSYTLTAGQS